MKVLYDDDADLVHLEGKILAVVGYGNQGRAQALNARDSGVEVIIGSVRDQSAEQAEEDGFPVGSIEDATDKAGLIALLVPDEIQPGVYREKIAPHLNAGQALVFAHGYNIHYGQIRPPLDVDVVMVAPRMIGIQVRKSFQKGTGAPAYLAVAQDASGRARDIALALSKAIGCTRAGVIETTFAQETELDLFTEQATWPIIIRDLLFSFDVLVEAGFPAEMVALELYGSGEASEVFRQMSRRGIIEQMRLHSRTSQYGTLSRGRNVLPEETKERMRRSLEGIRSGAFAREWGDEQQKGYPLFEELQRDAREHPINAAEKLARGMVTRAGLDDEAE